MSENTHGAGIDNPERNWTHGAGISPKRPTEEQMEPEPTTEEVARIAAQKLMPVTTRSLAAQLRHWAAITFPSGEPTSVGAVLARIEGIDPPRSTYKNPGDHKDSTGGHHPIADPKAAGEWRSPMPMLYASMMHGLREIAEAHGYCIAIHGSMVRDFDLIAVPWRENVSEPQVLIDAIQASAGWLYNAKAVGPSVRPHGRLAWTIPLGLGTALDLSIIPANRAP